jgi:SET domain-containing protein
MPLQRGGSRRIEPNFSCYSLKVGRSSIDRFGVYAAEAIPRGKKVIEYTGERLNNREAMKRAAKRFLEGKAGRVYMLVVGRRWTIDGAAGGSGAELVNHSCDPNLILRRIRGRAFLYSLRRIERGEELTYDYGFHCSCRCRCGSPKCRGTICRI